MQTKFFEFKLDNKKNEDLFKEAINALNGLIKYYQEIENANDTKLTIKLQTPWDREIPWGEDNVGIGGTLSFEPFTSPKHPLLSSLYGMGFQLFSHYEVNKKFSGVFSVFDARFIAEIPEKCQRIIGTNDKENNNSSFSLSNS